MKNTRILKFLECGGRMADRSSVFRPLNEVVRFSYLRLLAPAIETCFRIRFGRELRLVPRHSVVEPGGFNVFWSDLDFSAVVTSMEQIPSLVKAYQALSRSLWMLGELEIYTETEFRVLGEVRRLEAEAIDFVWNLRKLQWQIQAWQSASSTYHRAKAERAIQRTLRKLGVEASVDPSRLTPCDIASAINQRFVSEGHASLLSGQSNYLGWYLEQVAPNFVAILPHGEEVSPKNLDLIERLREIPEVSQRLAAICIFEMLLCRSKGRLKPGEWSEWWETYLLGLITRYASKDRAWANDLCAP